MQILPIYTVTLSSRVDAIFVFEDSINLPSIHEEWRRCVAILLTFSSHCNRVKISGDEITGNNCGFFFQVAPLVERADPRIRDSRFPSIAAIQLGYPG